MPKNKIEDLRNHLFEQLERLQDDEKMKNPLALERELKRSAAISDVAQVIVNTAKAETDFLKVTGSTSGGTEFIPLDRVKVQKQLDVSKPQG
jgi:hypothetical protein